MKKRLLCLLLILALLLTGCANVNFGGYFSALGQMMGLNTPAVTKFSDMTYTHPDMDALQETLDAACDTAVNGKNLQAVLQGILDYYDAYDRFYTNYYLADIYYCADLRDSYWADEYAYCGSNVSTADAGLETLYRALAQSPYRSELEGDDYFGADYFTAYDGEAFYDETLLDLFQQESDLISDYYVQNDKAAQADTEEAYYTTYVPAMEETLLSLIALRQKIAAYCGYDSYAQFAYDQSYYRDFTPEEAQDYLAAIQSELAPIYAQVRDLDTGLDAPGNEAGTVAYVASAAKAMGGTIQDAYTLLDTGHLYDLTPSAYKYNSSFEIYLDSYAEPFIFVCPTETVYDKLTFIHEFGHFANDYASSGASNSVDVSEIFSQAMTYLSLCYADGGEALSQGAMVDSLGVYVEQAAYASFEQAAYDLTDSDLSVENLRRLFADTCEAFHMEDMNEQYYALITHFFTNPMYILSYVLSNDAAMQIYQLELKNSGDGLKIYEENLTNSEPSFLAFLNSAGLEAPFGRIASVAQTFHSLLGE